MAIREIRVVGDRVLTKKCRPVEKPNHVLPYMEH